MEVPSSLLNLCLGKTRKPAAQGICTGSCMGPPQREEDGRRAWHPDDGEKRAPSPGKQVLNNKPLEGAGGCVCCVQERGKGPREGIFWRRGIRKTSFALELQRNWDTERSVICVGNVPCRQPPLPGQNGDHVRQGQPHGIFEPDVQFQEVNGLLYLVIPCGSSQPLN